MTTKQAIKTVLKDTNKFVIGDYKGQKWYCPDGYVATVDNIYEQYNPKKSQIENIDQFKHIDNQPKMKSIIERPGTYIPVDHLTKNFTEGADLIDLVASNEKVTVQKSYYLLMEVLYPTATFEIDTAYKYSPVKVMVQDHINGGNKLVAMIMPLHI